MNNNVYVLLADGFEEIEALTPVDVLRRAGMNVITVGIGGKQAVGAHGVKVTCDEEASDKNVVASPAALILPGGMPGAENIDRFPMTDLYIKSVLEAGGCVGAICAAPLVLGKRGYLDGRRAVCFPGFEKYLSGAIITSDDVVRDGQFITSRCMGTALPFALEIAEYLIGEEKRGKLENSIKAIN